MQTHYEKHIKQDVDRDPEVVAARERVEKLERELLAAKAATINAMNRAIARAQA